MLSRHKNQNAVVKSKINAGAATFVNNAAAAASEINAFKNDAVAAASKINYNATNASKSLRAPWPNLNCGRSIRIATDIVIACHRMSLHQRRNWSSRIQNPAAMNTMPRDDAP